MFKKIINQFEIYQSQAQEAGIGLEHGFIKSTKYHTYYHITSG